MKVEEIKIATTLKLIGKQFEVETFSFVLNKKKNFSQKHCGFLEKSKLFYHNYDNSAN